MTAEAVFGEVWFWALALAWWLRSALGVLGAPRRLIVDAQSDPASAETLRRLAAWRLGPRGPVPMSIRPHRIILLLLAAAWTASGAVFGDIAPIAFGAAVLPIAATAYLTETRLTTALAAATPTEPENAGDPERAARLTRFADAVEQVWRLRLAAVAVSVLATLAAAAATLDDVGPPVPGF